MTLEQIIFQLIGWQAYRETKNRSETLLYTTRKSNTGKVIRHLARLYTYKALLTADFGQIWGSRKLGSRSARNFKFFVCSMIGAQLEYPQNFRSNAYSQAELWDIEICV